MNNEFRDRLLVWLREQYQQAVTEGRKEYMWCLDMKKQEDVCLSPDNTTIAQIEDEIQKKGLPLRILRVFSTSLPFDSQVSDL
jgi:hypothetical protein